MGTLLKQVRRAIARKCHSIGERLDIHEARTAIIFFYDARQRDNYECFYVRSASEVPKAFWEGFHLRALAGYKTYLQPAIYISYVETNSQESIGTIQYSLNYENHHSVFFDYHGAHIRLNDFIHEDYEKMMDSIGLPKVIHALDGVLTDLQDLPLKHAA